MEADGFVAAGHRSALRVPRSRRGTTTSSRSGRRARCCRRCACSSTTRSCGPPTSRSLATGQHRARRARPRRAAVPAAGRACEELLRMKALVTGVAGFIGSTLAERLLARRRRRRRPRLLHRLLPARRSRKRNLAALLGAAAASASSRRDSGRRPRRRCSTSATHVFHLAAQAGVRKSWGRDFSVYTVNNIEATQVLLEACVGTAARAARLRLELVGLRRRRRDADARGRAAAAGLAVRRDEAGGRAALLPLLRELRRADRVAALLHRLRTAAAARHGASTSSCARRCRASRSRSTATASRRATSRSSPTRSRRPSPPATRGVPGRVYNIGGGSRVSINEVLEMIGRVTGRPPARRTRAGAEGRHAPHLRRHRRWRARDLGFAPDRVARRRARGRVSRG